METQSRASILDHRSVLLFVLQPMVFGAMIHRDEAFDAIFTQHTKIVAMATAADPETQ